MTGVSNLNGWYKRKYGSKQKPLPLFAILQRLIPFQKKAKTGETYNEPIIVQRSHGVTMQKTNKGEAYTLNAARSMVVKNAQIAGAEIIVRENIAYGALAASDPEGTSFGNIADEVVIGIEETGRFYAETNFLYGRTSIGTIETITADTSTTKVLTISVKSWAPGLWVNAENALIDIMSAPGGTKRNALADVVVTSLSDVDARKILVTGNATDVAAFVVGDVIVWKQADAEVCNGMDSIITNNTTLFGIDASVYSAWRGNTLNAGGAPCTTGLCHQAMTKCGVRGGMGDMTFMMSPLVLEDMLDDTASLRRYSDEQKKELVTGATSIKFMGVTGTISYESHPMVKCGEAFGIKPEEWTRGGESDLVSKLPGADNDNFFHEIQDTSAYQVRNFQSQFLLNNRPSGSVKITNIVPRIYS